MAQQIWLNGKLVPSDQAAISVFDHGLLYGDGVFEGIRVYSGRIFKFATHLRRLEESAKSIRLPLPYTLAEIDAATRQTVAANGIRDGYIRLCVTRGVGTLGLNPFTCEKAGIFIIAATIQLYPEKCYQDGLSIITATTIRNHPAALSPRVKSLNYLNNIMAKIEAIDAGAQEAVMLNHTGCVAECTGDNLFIVRPRSGKPTIFTPPLDAGPLEGVTMNTVIGLAQGMGLPVLRENLTRHDLYVADEMFLTGTAAEVVPVSSIDKRPIGAGKPGPITLRLAEAFRKLVAVNCPED